MFTLSPELHSLPVIHEQEHTVYKKNCENNFTNHAYVTLNLLAENEVQIQKYYRNKNQQE
jgi:hypothetical protein